MVDGVYGDTIYMVYMMYLVIQAHTRSTTGWGPVAVVPKGTCCVVAKHPQKLVWEFVPEHAHGLVWQKHRHTLPCNGWCVICGVDPWGYHVVWFRHTHTPVR